MNYFKDEILRVCVIIAMLAFWVMIFCVMKASADEIDDVLPFLIQAESGGNPNAVSKAGAIGLCQVTPIVLKEYINFRIEERYGNDLKRAESEASGFDGMSTAGRFEWSLNNLKKYPDYNKTVATWYLRRLRDHYLKERLERLTLYENDTVGSFDYDFSPMKNFFAEGYSWSDYKLALVLSAYNCGPTKLKSVGYDINKCPKETQAYVKKILKNYKESREKSC